MRDKKFNKYLPVSIISVAVFLIVWQIFATVNNTGMLPTPVSVVKAFFAKFSDPNPDGSTMWQHLLASLQVALSGYVIGLIVGIPLGVCMAWYKRFDWFARPLFDLVRPVPGIAWIPLMIILFGIGLLSKSMVIFISSFTACVINSYSGIKQTESVHLWVGQTYGASNSQMLFKIALPTALPMIMTGMKGALATSWGGAGGSRASGIDKRAWIHDPAEQRPDACGYYYSGHGHDWTGRGCSCRNIKSD